MTSNAPTLSKKKRILFTGIIIILPIVVGLVGLEVITRLIGYTPHKRNSFTRYDPDLGYVAVTGEANLPLWDQSGFSTHTFNEAGFISREVAPPSSPDEFRVLLLGDSFIASAGVPKDQGFPVNLETALSVSGQVNSRVFNLSFGGYSTDQELMAYQKHGPTIKPNVTILFFYLNDIHDNLFLANQERPYYSIADDRIVSHLPPKGSWSHIRFNLLGHSALFYRVHRKLFPPLDYTKPEYTYEEVDRRIFHTPPDPEIEQEWEKISARLKIWTGQSAELGATPLLVYIPSRDQINVSGLYPEISFAYKSDRRVQNKLAEISQALAFPFLDLTPVFMEQEQIDNRMYNFKDGHWNAEGIQFAVRETKDFILDAIASPGHSYDQRTALKNVRHNRSN